MDLVKKFQEKCNLVKFNRITMPKLVEFSDFNCKKGNKQYLDFDFLKDLYNEQDELQTLLKRILFTEQAVGK